MLQRVRNRCRGLFFDWIAGWLDIADGLVTVLTFGIINPSFCFSYTIWTIEREARLKGQDNAGNPPKE